MMGSMNPIPEFVVAPRIVIASPIFGIANASMKLRSMIKKVTTAFCFGVNLYSAGSRSSSRVSLQGRMVKGVAKTTTVRIPKSEM